MESNTQLTQPRQPDHPVLEHAKHLDFGLVARGLGLALAIVVGLSVIAGVIVNIANSRTLADDLPSFVSTFGFFFAFLAAGMYVAEHARVDRVLHTVALVIGGFVLAAVFTIADLASGLTIESLMPGNDATDAAQVHLGFWMVAWVAVLAAAFLGSAVVPREGQDWGTRHDEAEDTEL